MDHADALRGQGIFERAGIICRVVQQEPNQPQIDKGASKTVPSTDPAGQSQKRQELNTDPPGPQNQQTSVPPDFSFRGILYESWALIHGIKGKVFLAGLCVVILSIALSLTGYGISRFIGSPGRNLYVAYALTFGFGMFSYPLTTGIIMMGVRRAFHEDLPFSLICRFFTGRILLLTLIFTLFNYMLFAALMLLGIDHFNASAGTLLTLPVFAITAPLVIKMNLNPFAAIGRFFAMCKRHFLIMAGLYPVLVCISVAGSFILIGSIWTLPLLSVANGIFFRNLVREEQLATAGISLTVRPAIAAGAARTLQGNSLQNVFAVTLAVLIFVTASTRLWALNEAGKIYPPAHVAANGGQICVQADNKLYMLSMEGKLQRSVELGALGLDRAPADLELLGDGSLLIGDLTNGKILRCSMEGPSCRTVGPAGNYGIKEYFKFFADEKRGLLFIADTNNHRIIVQDIDGSYYRIIESPEKLDYPNDITMDEQGVLWVSNTFHERLLSFQVNGDSIIPTGRVIRLNPVESGSSAASTLHGLTDRKHAKKGLYSAMVAMLHTRPSAMAWGPDGNLWVVASDAMVNTAGIRIFDQAGRQVRHIPSDFGAIPDDIARADSLMLISDIGLFQVFAASSDSANLLPFGDEPFQRALTDSRTRLRTYEAIGRWSKWVLLVLALATVALLFIIRRGRRTGGASKS